ncbi:probable acyl-CoA dehydrogenase 6 isoform X3 [Pogoniulus pusillus]|uniref:probable acyl-CoA dehydrogenase 6 isoform X3 n=1 Tax=Pogoniulus pusillus TaxID=488313 RepID=UPI0030B98593
MALRGGRRCLRWLWALGGGAAPRRGLGSGRRDGGEAPEHGELRAALRKIIDKEINPFVDKWEEEGQFPAHKVFKTLGQAGFLGVDKPKEYGGMGLDFSYTMAVAEELGNVHCGAIPMAVGVQMSMATPALTRFGSDELKKEFLVPTIAGDFVACLGISEAGAGSDVASIKTTAVREGDEYIINGGKMWITSGCQADWMCLLANTSPGPPHRNKSLICLPMDLPVLPALEKVVEETKAYTGQRQAFGRPLLHNQALHFRLAELATELELLRSLLYRATDLYLEGNDVTKFASMAKLKAGRLAREVADSCLQFWGGMGFTSEVLVSRLYRDVRLLSIGGGADEVMLSIICKYMGMLPSK